MTVAEQITHEVENLSTRQQREALRLIRSMRAPKPRKTSKARTATTAIDKRDLHPAVRAIAGMWADRTDLPKDPVEAVKVLRARMRSRGRNNA